MYTPRWCLVLFLSLGVLSAQEPPVTIQVTGAVKQPLTLTVDELRFRLVVRKDKPGARSVRMLTKLEVVQLRK